MRAAVNKGRRLATDAVKREAVNSVVSVEGERAAAVDGDVGGGCDLPCGGAHGDRGVVHKQVAGDHSDGGGSRGDRRAVDVGRARVAVAGPGREEERTGAAQDERAARNLREYRKCLTGGNVGEEKLRTA